MKHLFSLQWLPGAKLFAAWGAFFLLTLSACSKLDVNNRNNYGPPFAQVEIANAAAGSPALDVSFDENRLGVSTFNFTDRIDYLRVSPGLRNFRVLNASTASSEQLFDKDLTFETGKFYTVFIVDTAAGMDVVALRDSSRTAQKDSVRIRFANMSPGAPALDLYVKGETTPIATNITYKNAGQFFSHKAALNMEFEIRPTGQSNLLATSKPYNLLDNRIYTIWAGGYINGNANNNTNIVVSAFSHNPLYY